MKTGQADGDERITDQRDHRFRDGKDFRDRLAKTLHFADEETVDQRLTRPG